jgi:hypothetical protein
MVSPILINFVLALLFGAAIGLERESSSQGVGSAGGIRTYSLIALLGAVCGLFYVSNLVIMAVLIASVFFIILISYYILNSSITKDVGLTTELSLTPRPACTLCRLRTTNASASSKTLRSGPSKSSVSTYSLA